VQFLPLPPDGGTGPPSPRAGWRAVDNTNRIIQPTHARSCFWVIKAHIFFDLNQDSIFFDLWGQ
jgi:hypothetical protein